MVTTMTTSKWTQGVQIYAHELQEFLLENKLEPTVENMLNGARSWEEYSNGGCSLIYDEDIADRLATTSEIARRRSKDGNLNSMANSRESWLDVQARALYQASRIVKRDQSFSVGMAAAA
jgi:hypothetical protein